METNEIICEALRKQLNTSVDGRAHTLYTENFSGDDVEIEFTFTDSDEIMFINSVTVAGTLKNKWADYELDDITPTKITFKSHAVPPSGTDNIVVSYGKGGTNWIYPDWIKENLSPGSYPRICCIRMPETVRDYFGYDSTVPAEFKYHNVPVQVTVLDHEKGMTTLDGVSTDAPQVVTKLSRQVNDFIEDYWRTVTYPACFHAEPSRNGLRKPPGSQLYMEDITINLENIRL